VRCGGTNSTGTVIGDDLVEILNSGRVVVPFSTPGVAPVSNADPLLNIAQQANLETIPMQPNAISSDLVAKVQKGLTSLGYDVGTVDGIPGEATATAIRRFENFYNYPQTGKVSPELIDILTGANAKF